MSNGGNIREKLKKLLTLAERGVPGEAANAQKLIDKLMAKHGLSMAEIAEPSLVECLLTCKTKFERELMRDIVFYVLQATEYTCHKPRKNVVAICDVTPTEAVEIEFLYTYHRKELAKVIEASVMAYTVKNFPLMNLHDGEDDTDSDTPLSEVGRIALRVYDSIPRNTPARHLTGTD